MKLELLFLIIYFVGMLGIGVWAMRRSSKSSEGFLLADRSLGPAVTALRLQSSSMSGYMFLGAGSLAYTQGYYSMWYALGDVGGGVLNLSIIGRRMRKLSQMLGSITSIGYLENRYPSRWTRMIAAPIALFCMFFYVLAQFLAGGQGLAMVTGLSVNISLIIAVGIIVGYTFLGGYLAVAYTDFFQAIVMVIGMLWILIGSLQYVGGLTAANERLGTINENLLTMWGSEGQYFGQWGIIIGALLVFSIGYIGWPHVNVSHMAMRRPSVARQAGLYATIFNLLFIPGERRQHGERIRSAHDVQVVDFAALFPQTQTFGKEEEVEKPPFCCLGELLEGGEIDVAARFRVAPDRVVVDARKMRAQNELRGRTMLRHAKTPLLWLRPAYRFVGRDSPNVSRSPVACVGPGWFGRSASRAPSAGTSTKFWAGWKRTPLKPQICNWVSCSLTRSAVPSARSWSALSQAGVCVLSSSHR